MKNLCKTGFENNNNNKMKNLCKTGFENNNNKKLFIGIFSFIIVVPILIILFLPLIILIFRWLLFFLIIAYMMYCSVVISDAITIKDINKK